MKFFCTMFDINYLKRGMTLYSSLKNNCKPFLLYILCLDDKSYEKISEIGPDNTRLITLSQLEEYDPDLIIARSNRNIIEYYFTCKPFLCLFLIDNNNDIDTITYLDSDLYYFRSPDDVMRKYGNYSVALTRHRFQSELIDRQKYGLYNAGWISFRSNSSGIECLKWWRNKCFEWCYDKVEPNRHADQKYLNYMPELFENVVIVNDVGMNTAPWNINQYKVELTERSIMIDGSPLVFYHFHSMKQVFGPIYNSCLYEYKTIASKAIKKHIYLPYIRELARVSNKLTGGEKKLAISVRFKNDNINVINGKYRFKLKKIASGLINTAKIILKAVYYRSLIYKLK